MGSVNTKYLKQIIRKTSAKLNHSISQKFEITTVTEKEREHVDQKKELNSDIKLKSRPSNERNAVIDTQK